MAITLVGVFDAHSDAQRACERLEHEGIDRIRMQLTGNGRAASPDGATGAAHEDHRGFFARLFGLGQPDADSDKYAEAVRRGANVVTVTVDDEDGADAVQHSFEACGAIDISRRAEPLKADGDSGREPAEPAESAEPAEPAEPRYSAADIAKERETSRVMRQDLRRYSGPERRVGRSTPYAGVERRAQP